MYILLYTSMQTCVPPIFILFFLINFGFSSIVSAMWWCTMIRLRRFVRPCTDSYIIIFLSFVRHIIYRARLREIRHLYFNIIHPPLPRFGFDQIPTRNDFRGHRTINQCRRWPAGRTGARKAGATTSRGRETSARAVLTVRPVGFTRARAPPSPPVRAVTTMTRQRAPVELTPPRPFLTLSFNDQPPSVMK